MKKIYILFSVIFFIIIIIGVVFFAVDKKGAKQASESLNENNAITSTNGPPSKNVPEANVEPQIKKEIPPPLPPPDPYEELKNLPLTQPDKTEPRGTSRPELFKYFTMRVSDSGFNPKNIVMGENEVIQLTFKPNTVVDVDSAVLHFYFLSKPGEDMVVVFGPLKKGAYPISCKNKCPASGPITGYIVVK